MPSQRRRPNRRPVSNTPTPRRQDRSKLDGFEMEIFELVRQHATGTQWSRWLQAPLEHAAAKGDMDLFIRLLDAGADASVGWRGCHGRTLLAAAAYGNCIQQMVLLLILLQGGGGADYFNATFGPNQESALHVAAMRGAKDVSKSLVLAGANPCVVDKDKRSPLHLAAEAGHHGVVNVLLLNGADPNAKGSMNNNKQTPLHRAAAAGHVLCVNELVVGGADKDARDWYSETPLHLATKHNHLGAVMELLAAGANQDIRVHGDHRCTALDMAVERGYVGVATALAQGGNRVNASARDGITALHHASYVDSLGPRRDNGDDNGDVIRVLLEAGADIEARTTDGACTPLHYAAMTDRSGNNVRSLLEGGACVHARGADGDTPLHDACRQSLPGVVELLLRWGADEKSTDKSGQTAGDTLGEWGQYGDVDDERTADDQRIRHLLARAPADRSWRRRGWLVLARSCPGKVQLAKDGNSDGGGGSGSCNDAGGGGNGTGDQTKTDWERLVGRVVGLDEEDVYRSVVGFL